MFMCVQEFLSLHREIEVFINKGTVRCYGKINLNGKTNLIPGEDENNKNFPRNASSYIERVIFYCLFVRYKIISFFMRTFLLLMTDSKGKKQIERRFEKLQQISVALKKYSER